VAPRARTPPRTRGVGPMIDYGSIGVVTLNLATVWGAFRVCLGWAPWAYRQRHVLAREPMGLLPLAVVWMVGWLGFQGSYYALARLLGGFDAQDNAGTPHAYEMNLWSDSWALLIWVIRSAVLAGLILHMIPLWRSMGRPEREVRRRTKTFILELAGITLVTFAVLFLWTYNGAPASK